MASSILVTPRTHWLNGWFLRLFARPVVRVDGQDYDARWGRSTVVEVSAGRRLVSVGVRYRGRTSILGIQEQRVEAEEGSQLALEARNGFFNHQPFRVVERSSASTGVR